MAKPLLTDELWERIEPLLPPEPPKPKGGRPPVPDRQALTGILFVLRTGCPWEYLPAGNGLRLRHDLLASAARLAAAGVWEKVWRLLLDELGLADEIDWSKAVVDSCSVRAVFGGRKRAPIPRIAAKMARSGTSSAMARGSPLAIEHTGANVHDSQQAIPLIDAIPPIKRPGGGRRSVPTKLFADRAYDAEEKIRQALRERRIEPFIAKRGHGTRQRPGQTSLCGRRRILLALHPASAATCATKNATTSTPRSSSSVACSSAGIDCQGFVRVPKLRGGIAIAQLSDTRFRRHS